MEHCASGRSCVWWVEMYLKDCVCGVRDYVSLCFGLISIFSWAIAEIPQIVTNFKSGSTEGLSLAFLMAWVVGDVFNLIGCLLVTTTLPTQFYTALLYTITTVVLVLQSLYYGHIYKWWKSRKIKSPSTDCASKDMSEHTEPVNVPKNIDNSAKLAKKLSNGTAASNLPIPTISPSSQRSIGRNIYYMSARSLASSHTPTLGSYISASSRGSGRSGPSFTLNQSSLDDEGLLASNGSRSPKNSKSTLRSVAATVFVVVGLNYFHLHANNSFQTFDSTRVDSRASVLLTGRKVLQEADTVTVSDLMISEQSTSLVGTSLGWIMAAIYMGGRLPQIWKNVQRGSVEGLNPMMFMFALIGNATYAGSILVRTLEWKKLKSDMPWLVDAGVCVLLDCFILAQFIYCKRRNHHADHEDNINADYEAINLVLDDQLPTQFYTALLYTITTEVLVCQSLYYGYICKCWNARKAKSSQTNNCARSDQFENTKTQPVNVPKSIDNSTELDNNKDGYLKKFPKGTAASSLPIRTISPARERSIGRNLYYISGRSFPGSHTSLPVSYLAASSHGSGLSGRGFTLNQSTVGDEGLLANLVPRNPKYSKSILRSVAATVFFVGGLNYFQLDAGNVSLTSTFSKAETASVVVTGRKILQELSAIALRDSMIGENSTSPVGTCLGWLMAAIYMGGLLPQICLNVQRGTVEGLNPLMFMFALIGHAAYVGSIPVRTLDWQKLKPNMPWLVDSIVCVLLDLIILAQFLYYKMKKPDDREDNSGDYQAVKP